MLQCPARWDDWVEERFRTFRLVTNPRIIMPGSIPLGRLGPKPTPPPTSVVSFNESEVLMLNRIQSSTASLRKQPAADLASLPIRNPHAAGIDVGDRTHWVCVEHVPECGMRNAE